MKIFSSRYLLLFPLHIVLVGSLAAQMPAAPKPTRTLVRAGKLLDVRTGEEASGKTIVVTGDKVTAIADTSATPAAASDAVIDLTKYTVMPVGSRE